MSENTMSRTSFADPWGYTPICSLELDRPERGPVDLNTEPNLGYYQLGSIEGLSLRTSKTSSENHREIKKLGKRPVIQNQLEDTYF